MRLEHDLHIIAQWSLSANLMHILWQVQSWQSKSCFIHAGLSFCLPFSTSLSITTCSSCLITKKKEEKCSPCVSTFMWMNLCVAVKVITHTVGHFAQWLEGARSQISCHIWPQTLFILIIFNLLQCIYPGETYKTRCLRWPRPTLIWTNKSLFTLFYLVYLRHDQHKCTRSNWILGNI